MADSALQEEHSDSEEEEANLHPVHGLWNEWKRAKKHEKRFFDWEKHRGSMKSFLQELHEQPNCFDVNCTGRATRCTCMRELQRVDLVQVRAVDGDFDGCARFATGWENRGKSSGGKLGV